MTQSHIKNRSINIFIYSKGISSSTVNGILLAFYSIKLNQHIAAELGVWRVHDVWHDLGEAFIYHQYLRYNCLCEV